MEGETFFCLGCFSSLVLLKALLVFVGFYRGFAMVL